MAVEDLETDNFKSYSSLISENINSAEDKYVVKKIAVAIEIPENSSPISEIFGRCNKFLFYNQQTNTQEFITNPFKSELGGAGIQSAKFLIENEVDLVIVKQIGINPLRFLKSANIKVFECKDGNATEALNKLKEGKLSQIENDPGDFTLGRKKNKYGNKYLKI